MNAIDEGMNPFLLKRKLLEKYERTFSITAITMKEGKEASGFSAQGKK